MPCPRRPSVLVNPATPAGRPASYGGIARVVYRDTVTEIPEHLLKRSQERRAAASGESSPAAAPATTSSPATVPTQTNAPAVQSAPTPPPAKPDPPYVAAAKSRKKIPFWAMAALSLLPLWGMLYVVALAPKTVEVEGPLAVGSEVFGSCSGCHGAAGGGGAGRQLNAGEVLKTFPHIEDMLNFVYNGSQAYKSAGIAVIGDPDREGGAHVPLAYNGNPMPQQGQMAGGGLTDAQILAVVCHERYVIGGADPTSEEWAEEYETWCSEESPIWAALEGGTTNFDSIDADFASLSKPPRAVGTAPRLSAGD